ncbi:MAG TPA: ABC transporter ATP-binding protein [Hydrogenispora sp.]|jgi:energy-coupling factor transporter ATP-binding protein EcfA2|nr:ABC transporter ATP-binding protein [Hydrogenispora sp.]
MEIKLEEISVVYPRKEAPLKALNKVGFTIKTGEAVALLGPIGSGKSTLLQVMAGLRPPTSGRISVHGQEGPIVLSIQEPQRGFFAATVREEVAFGPENLDLDPAEIEARVAWALTAVDLDRDKWETSPLQLSGGEQRRVALASALAMKPGFLLLDEPTIGLDGPGEEALRQTLKRIRTETAIGLVVASHDPDFLFMLTERVLVLVGGELQADTSWGTWAQKAAAVSPDLELPFLLGLLRRLAEAGAPVNAAPETPADAWDELFRLRREGEKGGKG